MTPDPTLPDNALPDDALAALAHRAVRALPDAPPALLHAAIGLFRTAQQPSLLAGLGAALREVVAVLRFDSWALPPQALGMRGSAADDSRHLLFSAEGRDVDLRITRQHNGGWALAGQVLGPDETGRIALTPADGAGSGYSAVLDELGEFHLADLRAGQWTLRLETGAQVVALPAIDVGAARPA